MTTPRPDHFPHKTVVVLEAFATSMIELHRSFGDALNPYQPDDVGEWWEQRVYDSARAAVRCARMLTLKDEYK